MSYFKALFLFLGLFMQGSFVLATPPALPHFARYKEAVKTNSITLKVIINAINELTSEEEINQEEYIMFLQKMAGKKLTQQESQKEEIYHQKATKLKVVLKKLLSSYNEYLTQLHQDYALEEQERRQQVKIADRASIKATQENAPFIYDYLKEIERAQNPCRAASEENSFSSEEDEGRMDISLERYSDAGLEKQDSLERASSVGTLVFQSNRYTW